MTARFATFAFALVTLVGCAHLRRTETVQLIEPDEVLVAQTDDGTTVALHHYRPRGTPAASIPVLVCHGISSNTHTWALGPGRDFGDYLARQGFDAFLVDLRGHGASGPAEPDTSLDTYAQYDVPAAIGAALASTGAERAVWVGHSMGGLVLVAYLESEPDPPLVGAVTVASPLDWRGSDRLTAVIREGLGLLSGRGPLPTRSVAAFYAQWDGELPLHLDQIVYAPDNMARPVLADMMRIGLSPIQSGVRRQFRRTMQAGRFVSADGERDYLAGAAEITTPFLVIAGRADHLSPPERTVTFFDQLGSRDKTWRVFGLDHGDHADYGHVDLCNGDHAEQDVYPVIADWLRRRIGE